MNRFATSSLLAAALMLCGTAHAQLSANLGLPSKYKYRGQDQSDPAKSTLPAVQAAPVVARACSCTRHTGWLLTVMASCVAGLAGVEISAVPGCRPCGDASMHNQA